MFCYAKVHGLVPAVYTLSHPAPEVGFIATLYAHNTLTNETVYSYPIGASMRDLTVSEGFGEFFVALPQLPNPNAANMPSISRI